MILKIAITVQIIAATIWTGGPLVLESRYSPKALKIDDFQITKGSDSQFKPIGLPSLLILVVAGIYFTMEDATGFFDLDFNRHYTNHNALKLGLLFSTVLLALHARLVITPKKVLEALAVPISAATLLSVLCVVVGFSSKSRGSI